MKLFQIQDEVSNLWHKRGPAGGSWVISAEDATIYLNSSAVNVTLQVIRRWGTIGVGPEHIAIRHPVVKEFDPFEAILVLRTLYSVRNLVDYAYDCEGEQVTRWRAACARAQNLLKRYQ